MGKLNINLKNHEEWLTPKYITDALGTFDLDPCSPIDRPWNTAMSHLTKNDDGLSFDWHGLVWLNPPYGKETGKWIEKLKNHNSGIALIFARTDTKFWHEHIWNHAMSLLFIEGRINFYYVDGTEAKYNGGAPSVLIAYGEEGDKRLANAYELGTIRGSYVKLNNMNTQTKETNIVTLPLQTWTNVLVKSDSLKKCLEDSDIKNAYLNGKMELLLHELNEFVSVNEKLLRSEHFDLLKKIIRKHTTTLDTYKNSDINAFVPKNIHE